MVSKVALGDVSDFIRGVAFDGNEATDLPKEGYVPILRAGNIGDELYIREDLVWVPEKRVSKEQLFQVGDIAICMASGSPAVLGKTAQLKENFMGSVGAFCGIIRPTKADADYIAYWLKSPTFMAWRDSQANGVNIQNLRPNEVREIEIPLPPLTEQKRIASLLRRADRLRHLRRTAHELGESLLQSVFLEMFGDPVRNEKGWERTEIREVAKIIVPTRDKPKRFSGDIPWVTLPDLNGLYVGNAKNLLTEEDAAEVGTRIMPVNTVLLSCAGSLGKVAITTRPVYTNQQFYGLIAKPDTLHYLFLAAQLKMFGEEFYFNMAGMSTLGFFSRDKALDIEIVLPPLSLQEEFAGVVARVESLRGRMSEGERQVNGLFESLLAEAFDGHA